MTTRTITGDLPQYPSTTVTFRNLDVIISSGNTHPPKDTTAAVNSSGVMASTALIVPDSGAARYVVTLPVETGRQAPRVTFSLEAGAATTLGAVIASALSVDDPDYVLASIDTHAAIKASATVLGHVKVGSGLAISGDGTLSAPGGSGDLYYRHVQGVAASTWTITHNLGKYPSISVVDTTLRAVWGDITHTDTNTAVVTFSAAFSGEAYAN